MKAEKAEIARRIDEVLRTILDGAEFHDIVQYASEKQWGVGERQLWNYVARANALLAERLERDRDKLLARHIGMRRNLYARCVNSGNYAAALQTAKDEAELENLYPAKKTEVTGKDGKPIQTESKVTHNVADELAPYADAIRQYAATVLGGGGGGGPALPDGPAQPVDTPPAQP